MALPEEKRDLLKILTSNRTVTEKCVVVEPSIPFREVAKRFELSNGDPHRDIHRTWDLILPKMIESIQTLPQDASIEIRNLLRRVTVEQRAA
jgi:hypothetical protein